MEPDSEIRVSEVGGHQDSCVKHVLVDLTYINMSDYLVIGIINYSNSDTNIGNYSALCGKSIISCLFQIG